MLDFKNVAISNFNYFLPKEKIAKFPLEIRDASKLLICKNGEIEQSDFKVIDKYLPENALMVFNETKVIQARIIFSKSTGATIEIFILEAVEPVSEIQSAFQQTSGVVWKCFVGNSKRWKSGVLEKKFIYKGKNCKIFIERKEKLENSSLIKFKWHPEDISFSEIIEKIGLVPLPPYLNREAVDSDKERYQTVYAKNEGSVAAPTAGLHFTENVLNKIKNRNISFGKINLHVGAGTFKPVIAEKISGHTMHFEKISIDISLIKRILKNIDGNIIPVGTTSVRTLESLYWYGVKLIVDKQNEKTLFIEQWDPYNKKYNIDLPIKEVLNFLISFMEKNEINIISGSTQLMIVPGYKYRIIKGMVTNFHQPQSTLLLLVAAFIGENWKKAYDFALENDFRFLSYGDSCLFM